MKQIVYVIMTGTGGESKIDFATYNEEERDQTFSLSEHYNSGSGRSQTKSEIIVDPQVASEEALEKLDAVDKLVLGITKSAEPTRTSRGGS